MLEALPIKIITGFLVEMLVVMAVIIMTIKIMVK